MLSFTKRLLVVAVVIAGCWPAGPLNGQGVPPADSLVTRLITLARRGDPALGALRADLAAADAAVVSAGALRAPFLGIEVEDIPNGFDLANAGQIRVMLEGELLTGARRSAEQRIARAQRDAVAARLDLAERSLDARVVRDLIVWRGWATVASRFLAEDTLLVGAEEGLRGRFAVGEARYVEVLRLRTERLHVRAEAAEALRASDEGRIRLDGLVASGDSLRPSLAEALAAIAASDAAQPSPDAFAPPPGTDSLIVAIGALRAGDLLVDASQGRADLVRANLRPRVIAGLGIQRFGDPVDGFQTGPSLRAGLSLPFAVPRSTGSQREAAELALGAALANRAAFEVAARTAMQVTRDRYVAALTRLRVYDAALLVGAREEREAALGAYRSGQLSLMELLDFERALARAEIDRLRAIIDAGTAYAQLFTTAADLAVPGGLSSDLEARDD